MPSTLRQRRRALAALAAAGVLWGASFPLGKFTLEALAPSHLVLCRFVLGTALLLPLGRWGAFRPSRADLGRLALTAALTVPATFLLQFEGLDRTTATRSALLVGTIPPLVALMAWLFGGERPGRRTVLAAVASALGVGLLVGAPGAGRALAGDLLVFASLVTACAGMVLSKRLVRRYDALTVTAAMFALGTAMLGPAALWLDGPPALRLSASTWAAVVALGVGCTAATYALWNRGLEHVDAAEAGVYANLEPLVGALLGVLWLGEAIGPAALLGGVVILSAALVVTVSEARRPTPAPPLTDEPPSDEPRRPR